MTIDTPIATGQRALSPERERKQRQIDAKLERRQTIVRRRVLAEREREARRAARRKLIVVGATLIAACVAMWIVIRWFGLNVAEMFA